MTKEELRPEEGEPEEERGEDYAREGLDDDAVIQAAASAKGLMSIAWERGARAVLTWLRCRDERLLEDWSWDEIENPYE